MIETVGDGRAMVFAAVELNPDVVVLDVVMRHLEWPGCGATAEKNATRHQAGIPDHELRPQRGGGLRVQRLLRALVRSGL